jgi:hypothetical protein
VFQQRGVRAQIGYMGNWIELVKERKAKQKNPDLYDATFKRTLLGL